MVVPGGGQEAGDDGDDEEEADDGGDGWARDLNVDAGTIAVAGAIDKTTGKRKATKTAAGARTVHLPRSAVELVSAAAGERSDPDGRSCRA